jgi:hypothetical protein
VKRRDRWRPVMRRCSVPGLNNASPATWARDQIAKRIIKMAQNAASATPTISLRTPLIISLRLDCK